MSVELFGKLFQMDGAAWLKAQLPKAVLTLLVRRRFSLFDLSDLIGVWNEIKSAKYVGLLVVTALKITRAILNAIRS